MYYINAKVYFDGSHYIAIPRTVRPYRERRKRREENIIVPVKSGTIAASAEKSETVAKHKQT